MFKGVSASWLKECFYSTLRLGTYEPCRNYLSNGKSPLETSFYVKFVAGGFAGLIGSTFSAPADILKVRMQACEQLNPPSLRWHITDIHSNWGFQGFLKGVQPAIARAIVLNAVFLSSYDHIKQFILSHQVL